MYKSSSFRNFEINRDNNGFDFELVSRIMKKKIKFFKNFSTLQAKEKCI